MPSPASFLCPTCHAGHGIAVRVTTAAGKVSVTNRCPACRHEWNVPRRAAAFTRPLAVQVSMVAD